MGNVVVHRRQNAPPFEVRYPTELTVSGIKVTATFDASDMTFPFEMWGCFMLSDTRTWNPEYISYSPAVLSVCAVLFGNDSAQQNRTGYCIRKYSSATEAGWTSDADYTGNPTISLINGVLSISISLSKIQTGDTAGVVKAAYVCLKK